MAQAVSRRSLTAEYRVRARVGPCKTCGGRSGAGIGDLRVIRYSPVSVIPPWLSVLMDHLGMNNRPVGSNSSEP
jgi:hypothetical protein